MQYESEHVRVYNSEQHRLLQKKKAKGKLSITTLLMEVAASTARICSRHERTRGPARRRAGRRARSCMTRPKTFTASRESVPTCFCVDGRVQGGAYPARDCKKIDMTNLR